jgi:hypothetical protein
MIGCRSLSLDPHSCDKAPEIAGRARLRFFVSGNGDGGLIDFVAAATADFSHVATIDDIVRQAGIREIFERLKVIDLEARQAHAAEITSISLPPTTSRSTRTSLILAWWP